jgi:uncharacterized protein (TIGR02246 family)
MRTTLALCIAVSLGGALMLSYGEEVSNLFTPEERTATQLANDFAAAYNNGDAKALAEMFTTDAEWIADDGNVTKGRADIEELFRKIFSANKGRKLELTVESARPVTPEVLLETGVSTLEENNGTTTSGGYSAVHVNKDGHWLVAQLTETGVHWGGAANELHALAWLVGSWVEKSPGVEVRENVEWTANRKFLTRSYTLKRADAELAQGTEVIGWDPAMGKVRSWAFDSDGGFSESTWTRDGNRWIILVKATVPDGRQASAQHTLTYMMATGTPGLPPTVRLPGSSCQISILSKSSAPNNCNRAMKFRVMLALTVVLLSTLPQLQAGMGGGHRAAGGYHRASAIQSQDLQISHPGFRGLQPAAVRRFQGDRPASHLRPAVEAFRGLPGATVFRESTM